MTPPTIVLASSSPRRQELLKRLTPHFEIALSEVEATGSHETPDREIAPLSLPTDFQIRYEDHPTLWAWRKGFDVAEQMPADRSETLVLGADTVVIGRGALLGKPKDVVEALAMLSALRGKEHYVATGFALLKRSQSLVTTLRMGAVTSLVWMRPYSDRELEGYVATGEPLDKAGAYAVQGLGGNLVDRVEGCYYNVVGLPLCDVREALYGAGAGLLPRTTGGYCEFCPLHLANR